MPRVDPEDARLASHVESYKEVVAEKDDYRASFALSPDGRLLIKYARVKGVLAEIVDAKTNQLIRAVQGTRATPQVYWKPDSREFITASWNNTKIHDAFNGDAKDDIGRCEPTSGSFSPVSNRFAIANRDYQLRIYDTNSWKQVGPALPHACRVAYSKFSPDGSLVFSSDADSKTRVWHPSTGKRIGPVFIGGAPIICKDEIHFTTLDVTRSIGYTIPIPSTGTVAEIVDRIETLTGQHGFVAPDAEKDFATNNVVGPEEARDAVGQSVILEMKIASAKFNTVKEWLYLNSEEDYKNTKNLTVAIKYPTPERLKAMSLDSDINQVVSLSQSE